MDEARLLSDLSQYESFEIDGQQRVYGVLRVGTSGPEILPTGMFAERAMNVLVAEVRRLREFVLTYEALQAAYRDDRSEDVYALSASLDKQMAALSSEPKEGER